jgi:hypothetical protein
MLILLAGATASCRETTVAGSGNSLDLVGAGGAQDALAREIYHPGRGTDW